MFGGFAKLELAKQGDSAIAGQLDHGPGKFGSEPFFVAAHSDPSQCDGEPCIGSPTFVTKDHKGMAFGQGADAEEACFLSSGSGCRGRGLEPKSTRSSDDAPTMVQCSGIGLLERMNTTERLLDCREHLWADPRGLQARMTAT